MLIAASLEVTQWSGATLNLAKASKAIELVVTRAHRSSDQMLSSISYSKIIVNSHIIFTYENSCSFRSRGSCTSCEMQIVGQRVIDRDEISCYPTRRIAEQHSWTFNMHLKSRTRSLVASTFSQRHITYSHLLRAP